MLEKSPFSGGALSIIILVFAFCIPLYLKPKRSGKVESSIKNICQAVMFTCILAHFWSLYQSPHYIFAGATVALLAFTERFIHNHFSSVLTRRSNTALKILLPIVSIYLICFVVGDISGLNEVIFSPIKVIKSALTTDTPWAKYPDTLAFGVVCIYIFSYKVACCRLPQRTNNVPIRQKSEFIIVTSALITFVIPALIASSGTFIIPHFLGINAKFSTSPVNAHQDANLQIDSLQNLTDNYRTFFTKEMLKHEIMHIQCASETCTEENFLIFATYNDYDGVRFKVTDEFDQIVKLDTKTSEDSVHIKLYDYPFAFLPMISSTTSLNLSQLNNEQSKNVYYSKGSQTALVNTPYTKDFEYEINRVSPRKLSSRKAPVSNSHVQDFTAMFSKIIQHSYLSRAYFFDEDLTQSESWLAEGSKFVPSFSGVNLGLIEKNFLSKVDVLLSGSAAQDEVLVGDEEQLSALGFLLAKKQGLDARLVTGARIPNDCLSEGCALHGEDMRIWFEVREPLASPGKCNEDEYDCNAWQPVHFEIPTHNLPPQILNKALPTPQALKFESTNAITIPRLPSNIELTNTSEQKYDTASIPSKFRLPAWLMYLLEALFGACAAIASVVYFKYRAYKCRRSTLVALDLWYEFCLRLKRHKLPSTQQHLSGKELETLYKNLDLRLDLKKARPKLTDIKINRIAEFCRRFDELCFSPGGSAALKQGVRKMWQDLEMILPRKAL